MDAFQPKDQAESIALFRSQLIGPLTVRELSRGELAEELQALSRKLFRTPRSHCARTYSVPTLERTRADTCPDDRAREPLNGPQ